MLVKAWETKVFPTIRRRFRNEAERKSGLDQIKGALQLGKALMNLLQSCTLEGCTHTHSLDNLARSVTLEKLMAALLQRMCP